MNVSITEQQKEYIAKQIAMGDFQNASELVRDALRLHKVYRKKVIEDLQIEIEKGWEGESSKRSVLDIVKAKQKQS